MKRIKKGFTIVELVIVIGVIGILSAILIPTFVGLSDNAKKAAAKSEVADAYTQYVLDKSEKEEAYLAQTDVVIYYKSDAAAAHYVYSVADGWKVDETAEKKAATAALYFVDLNENSAADATDIVVYEKAAA